MSGLKSINIEVFSEAGFDRALHEGRFNSLAEDANSEFESFWWKEIQRFEKAIIEKFTPNAVFVSDGVPAGKRFGVDILDNTPPAQVFEFILSYLASAHRDASVVVAGLLGAPMPAARLVMGLEGCALDQDAVAWFLNRASVERVRFGNNHQCLEALSATDISGIFPWLDKRDSVLLPPSEFWSMIYSGNGFVSMENEKGEDWQSYNFGHKVIAQIIDCLVDLDVDGDDYYLSSSLPKQRIIKIECSRCVLSEKLFEKVVKTVRDMDQTWGVRFSIFENLNGPDSYLGGIVHSPSGQLFLESGRIG